MPLRIPRFLLHKRTRLAIVVWIQIALMLNANLAWANPFGATVVAGSAGVQHSGNTVTITQGTDRAVINWQGFSIAPGELTQFIQPGSHSAILNRVTGGDPSALMGAMQSNGQIFLINPNGILVGPNATINVGGLTASTLDISNSQFMQGGDLVFSGNSTASVVNYGTIRALEGNIYLIGSSVANHGVLQASKGTVGLAAGQEVKLVDSARQHLVVRATSRSLSNIGVQNTGTINALSAELAANGGNVYALAINNEGVIRATGSKEIGGRIYLTGPGGTIANHGDLIAKNADGSGGEVKIDAGPDGALTQAGRIDVSGLRGGSVDIQAGYTSIDGEIDAQGQLAGGSVAIQGETVDQMAAIRAGASDGPGGSVVIGATGAYTATVAGNIDVSGASGGNVFVSAGTRYLSSGTIQAVGYDGEGGHVDLTGVGGIALLNGTVDASGVTGGGRIRIGGEYQGGKNGSDEFANSATTLISTGSQLLANATGPVGNGGTVIVWSDTQTQYFGDISAVGGSDGGAGGFVELSSGDQLVYTQLGGIATGGGTILFDPRNGYITCDPPTNLEFLKIASGMGVTLTNNDHFGSSVALNDAGDILAVGATGDDTGGPGSGAAYIFTIDPTDLSVAPTLQRKIADDGMITGFSLSNNDGFGSSLALNGAGSILAVGASKDDTGGNGAGAVYLFSLNTASLSSAPTFDFKIADATVTGLSLSNGYNFGSGVSLNTTGNILAVGASGQTGGGAAYLFNLDTANLTNAPDLRYTISSSSSIAGFSLSSGDEFGSGVALDGAGDILAVGASGDNAVHLFSLNSSDLTQTPVFRYKIDNASGITGFSLSSGDEFGAGVALNNAGNMLAVGAPGDDTGTAMGSNNRGAAYEFNLDPTNLTATPTLTRKIADDGTITGFTLENNVAFGSDVALNGAGSLLSVGSLNDNTGAMGTNNRGAAYVFGIPSGILGDPSDVFATTPGIDTYLTPMQLTALLNAGNNVNLQFNNDLTVLCDVIVDAGGGTAGNLTIQTGRSILIYANIFTDGGDLSLFANEPLAAGVIDQYREDGDAVIFMDTGTWIDTGAGNFTASLGTGAGLTYNSSGDVTITTVTSGGYVLIENRGPSLGDIVINANTVTVTGTQGTTLRSLGDIILNGSVMNTAGTMAGEGGVVNLIAGWDGVTGLALADAFNFSLIAADTASYGNNSGTIYIGDGAQTQGIFAGSRFGASNFAAAAMTLRGSDTDYDAFAQAGFRADTSMSGFNIESPITVLLDDGAGVGGALTMIGGAMGGSYVQVGNGGEDVDGDLQGDITINAGSLALTAGAYDAYAQIGHGGEYGLASVTNANIDLTFSGDVTMTAAQEESTAQIGHGGRYFESTGDGIDATITLVAGGALSSTASGYDAVGQIGHGGYEAFGSVGDIDVSASYVELIASGTGSTDQIGHGGPLSSGSHVGDITVEATGMTAGTGYVRLEASGGYDGTIGSTAQIGHGGYLANGSAEGDITVTANGPNDTYFAIDLSVPGEDNFAQIGHGGIYFNDSDTGALSGIIEVNAPAGGVRAVAGSLYSPVQIGHGGDSAYADSITGAIRVTALGNILFFGGDDVAAYAQLGHGGDYSYVDGTIDGNIRIQTDGNVRFLAGTGDEAYAQLGHGGDYSVANEMSGRILVTAANFIFAANSGNHAYAQLGHGGNESEGYLHGNINLTGAQFKFDGSSGNDSYAQIGHGGDDFEGVLSGNITVDASSNIRFTAGSSEDSYVQIGHGGNGSGIYDDINGRIQVTAAGDIQFTAGGDEDAYAQIGHGGAYTYLDGDVTGNIRVKADGNVVFKGGAGDYAYAQIGHGGSVDDWFEDNIDGNITVRSGGNVRLLGGDGLLTYAQIGHGGGNDGAAFGDINGRILVKADNDVRVLGGSYDGSYAQIGHGGSTDGGLFYDLGGRIRVVAANNVVLKGGDGFVTYAQIGHGGSAYDAEFGDLSGRITVKAGNDVRLDGGDNADSDVAYAQIGHGGEIEGGTSFGDIQGRIKVVAQNNVVLNGGDGFLAYAHIGHGGSEYDSEFGELVGRVTVKAGNDVRLRGGNNDENGISYAQIGHGGSLGGNSYVAGDVRGRIKVVALNDILLTGGTTYVSYAQIGHGGALTEDSEYGNIYGNIRVNAGNDIKLKGGDYSVTAAQIGHGGFIDGGGLFGDINGNIRVNAVNNILVRGGNSSYSDAQIGHGGSISNYMELAAFGAITGNILVVSELGDVKLTGGDGGTAYAQIGHGGSIDSFMGAAEFASITGTIGVLASQGDVVLKGGGISQNEDSGNYAQIGHGGSVNGYMSSAGFGPILNSDIRVLAANDIKLTGADAYLGYALIGHGGAVGGGVFEEIQGNIYTIAGNDVLLKGGMSYGTFAQIGHGGLVLDGDPFGDVSGNIVVLAGHDISLNYNTTSGTNLTGRDRAQIGHGEVDMVNSGTPLYPVSGDILVAWDVNSQVAGTDLGGRLYLGDESVIGVGGSPDTNHIYLFGFRRGDPVNVPGSNFYADGAIIGGYSYDSSLAQPTHAAPGSWRENVEFVSWDQEEWGYPLPLPLNTALPLLVDVTGLPYSGPFTFYYPEEGPPPPPPPPPGPMIPTTAPIFDVYWQYTAHGWFSQTVMYMFPNNPYFSDYGPSPNRPLGELAGGSTP